MAKISTIIYDLAIGDFVGDITKVGVPQDATKISLH